MSDSLQPIVPLNLFYSYSHEDEELRNKLEKQLKLLNREGYISEWHDRKILSGSEIDNEISDKLEQADIILLLISADFIASDYCYEIEMTRAMERHQANDAIVVPVILRTCEWHSAPFGKLSALPRDGKAITGPDWHSEDEAFTDVAKGIRKLVEKKK